MSKLNLGVCVKAASLRFRRAGPVGGNCRPRCICAPRSRTSREPMEPPKSRPLAHCCEAKRVAQTGQLGGHKCADRQSVDERD